MRYIFLLLAISVSLAVSSKAQFAIYVVKGTPHETAAHRGGPDLANAEVENPPLLTQDDVVIYDWGTHSITLTPAGEKKLFEYKDPASDLTGRKALRSREFIVMADGERCYGGAFWWRISSAGYQQPVIDVYTRAQTIKIKRFFGAPSEQPSAPDPRFDPRIERVLKNAHKIKNVSESPPNQAMQLQRTARERPGFPLCALTAMMSPNQASRWANHCMRKLIQTFFATAFVCGGVAAQTTVWQPSEGHTQVPIWPQEPPGAQPATGPEQMKTVKDPLISAGQPWLQIDNVSQPTMTVYSPKGKNTGAAVVVFPGGGYRVLAIDLQGTEICDWLTSKGITAVLLKYRVPTPRLGPYRESALALQDAQRTVGLVRLHAAEWEIDPHKIGVIGFSAGGHMVTALSTHFDERLYPSVDAADKKSCRPDFAIALYPGHLSNDDTNCELNPNIPVASNTPPTFLVHAEDDPVNSVNNSLVYYLALKKAGVPVEMHLYAEGGHAFALRETKLPLTDWPRLVEKWLGTIGMTPK